MHAVWNSFPVFLFLLSFLLLDSKVPRRITRENSSCVTHVFKLDRGTSSSSWGTLTATCPILTAAIHFDNYSDANGCERCVFSGDPHRVGELRGRQGRGDERNRGSCQRIPFCKCQSALSRTHSWLSINIVVDSTLARSFIELSFRLNGQIAWVVAFCLYLCHYSLSVFVYRKVCLFYEHEHRWCYLRRALPPLYNRVTRWDCERRFESVIEIARQFESTRVGVKEE